MRDTDTIWSLVSVQTPGKCGYLWHRSGSWSTTFYPYKGHAEPPHCLVYFAKACASGPFVNGELFSFLGLVV